MLLLLLMRQSRGSDASNGEWLQIQMKLCSLARHSLLLCRPRSIGVHGLEVVDPSLTGRESHFTSDEVDFQAGQLSAGAMMVTVRTWASRGCVPGRA